MERKLFNPLTRIHTKGVDYRVSQDIITHIWIMIDVLSMGKELDYLHIFNFRIKRNNLVIEHRQEVPKYRRKHTITNVSDAHKYSGMKIYVIDDYDYSIMMLASEY